MKHVAKAALSVSLALCTTAVAMAQSAPTPVPLPQSAPPPAPQPSANFAALLAANSYSLAVENGRLSGPGADLLFKLAEQSQFVMLGEDHNNRDIPPFTSALFRGLHERAGFNYFAEEQDAVTTRWLSRPPLRGNLAAIRTQAGRYKHSFTFDTDEELAMLADIGRISTGKGNPIWGCEQVFGATHILEAIMRKAPNAAARSFVEGLLAEARPREATRDGKSENRYLMDQTAAAKMPELRRLYAAVTDTETRFLVDALAKSFEIYGYYTNGDKNVLPGYYSNNAVREEYMKSVCRDEYRRAERLDGKPPRALAKFGHYHLYQGLSPTTVVTTGNFLANVARLNGLSSVSIAIIARSYDGEPAWGAADFASLSAFKDQLTSPGLRLIDLRPFREYPNFNDLLIAGGTKASAESQTNLKRFVYGFDFLLFFDDRASGHYTARDAKS